MNKQVEKKLGKLNDKLVALFEDLQHYSDITLNLSPSDTSWSVLEIMQHLYLAERLSLQQLKEQVGKNTAFAKAGFGSRVRSFALNTALSLPFKFKAPYAINRDAFISNPTFWEVAKEWNRERAQLKQFLQGLPPELFVQTAYKHPRGGLMTLNGMLSFFDNHFDRHCKQIKRTLKAIDAVKQL